MDSLAKALLLFSLVLYSLPVQSRLLQTAVTVMDAPISPRLKALLSTVCKKADEFNICIQTLKSIPKISKATNLKDVKNIALDVAIDQTRRMHDFFALSFGKETVPDYKVALATCVEAFKDAEGCFHIDGVKGLTALTKVFGARSEELKCEEGLVNHHFDIGRVKPKLNKWINYYGVAYNGVDAVESQGLHKAYYGMDAVDSPNTSAGLT
ncbi:hypothetical protein K2173_016752 [Erythroxylum novogranatense]|uniref:Pectinesterase inhibitor domain-containing protein n=1 Tax=Erythroxylum novogranatense TaxID=1862640 RepID=A0AAV8SGY4_9ROSI|nr:hypothetical protein K2173_016752 [Erythroxylum novogranatense]